MMGFLSIEHITVSIDSGGKVDIALQSRPAGEECPDMHEAETDKYEKKVPDIQVFRAFEKMLHMNLDSYNNDFNRSLQDSMGLDKHLKVFNEMIEIMKEKFDMA